MGVLQLIWLCEIMGGMLLMCQNTIMRVYGARIKRYCVLCSKRYSSSSSLVITSHWFATRRLVVPVSVRLVYYVRYQYIVRILPIHSWQIHRILMLGEAWWTHGPTCLPIYQVFFCPSDGIVSERGAMSLNSVWDNLTGSKQEDVFFSLSGCRATGCLQTNTTKSSSSPTKPSTRFAWLHMTNGFNVEI